MKKSEFSPKELRDVIAIKLRKAGGFKMSREEALKNELCIACGERALPKCYSSAGRKEYFISATCEKCFDRLFPKEE